MGKMIDYLKRKNREPVYWDRLALIIFANIMIAMGIIAIFDWHRIEGVCFGFSVGVITYIHYWRGGRILVDLGSKR